MMKTASCLLICALFLPLPLRAGAGCAKNEACSDSAGPASPFLEAARKPAAPEPAKPAAAKPAGQVKAAPAAAAPLIPAAAPEIPAVPAPPAGGQFARPLWFVFAGLGLLALYLYLRERPGRKEKKR